MTFYELLAFWKYCATPTFLQKGEKGGKGKKTNHHIFNKQLGMSILFLFSLPTPSVDPAAEAASSSAVMPSSSASSSSASSVSTAAASAPSI